MAEIVTYILIYWSVGFVIMSALERVATGSLTVRDLFETIPYSFIWVIFVPFYIWKIAEDRGWLDKKLF
jgi:hypothetical protein